MLKLFGPDKIDMATVTDAQLADELERGLYRKVVASSELGEEYVAEDDKPITPEDIYCLAEAMARLRERGAR